MAQEVQRVLQFYYTTQPTDAFSNVKHILLTGSASQQTGLAESIFSQTNTATQCIQPVTYVERGGKVDLSQLQVDASAFDTCIWISIKGIVIMTELIKINLLPYREEIKQRKRQQFKILMLSSLLIGVGLSAIAYLAINNAIKLIKKVGMHFWKQKLPS